jgi:4-amino-4-deoxy-L-arabinose transferase-like glycosyltransferase
VGSNQPWVQAVQIAVAALGAPLMYRLTATLTRQTAAASLGAALFAVDPLLIGRPCSTARRSLTTTLLLGFTCLFTGAATTTRTAAAAGTVLGLAIATRTMLAPLVVAGALILAGASTRSALRSSSRSPPSSSSLHSRQERPPERILDADASGANLFGGNHPYARGAAADV